MPSLVGHTVRHYVLVAQLGEGGMSAVYLGRHPLIGKQVAIKVLHPALAVDDELVDRFFHEAKAVNDIGHPNIVDVLDYGNTDGLHWLIMERLCGESLADRLRLGRLTE